MTREEAICRVEGYLTDIIPSEDYSEVEEIIKALKQESNTWSLDDAREDFMYDVYNTLDFLPTNNEANRIIDSFDRVTSGLNQQPCEDCISRQDVLDITNFEDKWLLDAKSHNANTDIAFSTIKSKLSKMPSVIPKGITVTDFADKCRECGREKVLDKIIAEIAIPTNSSTIKDYDEGWEDAIKRDLQIIDKYKAESVVKE